MLMPGLRISKTVILFFMIVFLFSQITVAEDKLGQWRCSARIAQNGTCHYKAFFLNEQVYQNAKADLTDLRIVDQNSRFVPYFIVGGYGSERENKTSYRSQLIKRIIKNGNTIFDFRVAPLLKTADIMGNELKFDLPDQNFLKKVDVYGGYDSNTWEFVSHDQLYRVEDLIKDQILLGGIEKYTYYRIVILKNSENIQLQNLQLIYKNIKKDWSSFQRSSKLKYTIADKPDNTIITLLNPRHLKVRQISFSLSGNFRREYQVFDDPKMIVAIKTGDIFNLKFHDLNISETTIDFIDNPCSSPIIKISIINHDNPPLLINDIQTDYYLDKIVFEALAKQDYRLYFGNPAAQQPIYDLESFKDHILNEPINSVSLQDFQISSQPKAAAFDKSHLNVIFNIVVVAVTLLLIIFLIKKLNSQKA